MPLGGPNSERSLILAGRRRDAKIASRVLAEAGLATLICSDAAHLAREMRKGAAFGVITDEVIDSATAQSLHS